ncbi:MAG: CinA family protein [Flavobacterium sp.]
MLIKAGILLLQKGHRPGGMSAEFSLTPYAGQILRGGIVCYEVFVKEQILHVPHYLIKEFTEESMEVTQFLARQCAHFFE